MSSVTPACSLSTLMWYPSISTDGRGRKGQDDNMTFVPFGFQQQYGTYLFPTSSNGNRSEGTFPKTHFFDCPTSTAANAVSEDQNQRPKPTDPFAPECLIPMPNMYMHGDEMLYYEPVFVRRRNERERQRVRCVNDSYNRLRNRLPLFLTQKRMSKVEILRSAIAYIRHLQAVLESADANGNNVAGLRGSRPG